MFIDGIIGQVHEEIILQSLGIIYTLEMNSIIEEDSYKFIIKEEWLEHRLYIYLSVENIDL